MMAAFQTHPLYSRLLIISLAEGGCAVCMGHVFRIGPQSFHFLQTKKFNPYFRPSPSTTGKVRIFSQIQIIYFLCPVVYF